MSDVEMAVLEMLRRIAVAQERIADAVEVLVAPPQASEEPTNCPHPEEQRHDFGTTNGQPDWQCGVCGYRTVTT